MLKEATRASTAASLLPGLGAKAIEGLEGVSASLVVEAGGSLGVEGRSLSSLIFFSYSHKGLLSTKVESEPLVLMYQKHKGITLKVR